MLLYSLEKITINIGWINVLFRVLDALEKYLDNIIHFKNEGIDHNESIMKDLDYILGTDDNEPQNVLS